MVNYVIHYLMLHPLLEETIMITMDLAVVRGGLSFYSYSHLWEMDSMVIVALMDNQ